MEKVKIGLNAGTIWRFLNSKGQMSTFELCRKLNFTFEDAMLAIGWLARENKIIIKVKSNMLFIQVS